ncbi:MULTISPECIES: hypothetical protein [Chryseobacterium]|uniref:Cellulose synthase/poly-beta-1,6-N-acetylglucosamine synthase-like glycosyltransferase n=1 Tax=Chryseobacterium camelliae TaxID=1265445 RepID=A0ABU0TCW8_9FLAO|nr:MULTISPECIES: hypothetical protein [Chryseobacterium]MDT3407284.1 cellulose synthase/poly-beta-1,6-N-acetylglucosamine synthase-like glycosyltransferase [Pseudacidovorax intermedius]MDQ1094927.1 cellulose synthase/poly-beta-1,6-N-acetylglucosamine synthase-like glycosyltransferase [Chryseobacterium camelliae]MDQ1098866.1 cellulose synthase/poly-beta-1,6-N-acetylglucosamine synthase-like glycosyltransferase [Chryseobacterium sp. SORGH_AS_1048]MDR6086216.1 cellulose synthase/poly-beta-1,6-N-ac
MKKFLLIYTVFTVLYVVLIVVTSPFLLTWGEKRSFLEKLYVWFLTKPFNLEFSAGLILANSLFWTSIIFLIQKGINLIRK